MQEPVDQESKGDLDDAGGKPGEAANAVAAKKDDEQDEESGEGQGPKGLVCGVLFFVVYAILRDGSQGGPNTRLGHRADWEFSERAGCD